MTVSEHEIDGPQPPRHVEPIAHVNGCSSFFSSKPLVETRPQLLRSVGTAWLLGRIAVEFEICLGK